MKICNQCGQTHPMDTKYCLRCGSSSLRIEGGTQVEKPKLGKLKTQTLDTMEAQPQKVPQQFKNPNAVKMPKQPKKIERQEKQPRKTPVVNNIYDNTGNSMGFENEHQTSSFGGYGAQDSDIHVSVKEWLITTVLMMIPFFNIYYIISLAFSKKKNVKPSLRNWAKLQVYAAGIAMAIGLVFMLISFVFVSLVLNY